MRGFFLLLIIFFPACKSGPPGAIITVEHTRQTVKLTGLPETSLNGISRDSISLEAWQNLFPVMMMPVDTDMRDFQRPMNGKYNVTNTAITFTPDTLFKSGQTYFARYYHYDKEITALYMALHKRALGRANYSELIFKY